MARKIGDTRMPTIGASVAATLAGFLIDGVLRPFLGLGPTLLISLAATTVVFFVSRKWLRELRDR